MVYPEKPPEARIHKGVGGRGANPCNQLDVCTPGIDQDTGKTDA